jgi:hypothetical protein
LGMQRLNHIANIATAAAAVCRAPVDGHAGGESDALLNLLALEDVPTLPAHQRASLVRPWWELEGPVRPAGGWCPTLQWSRRPVCTGPPPLRHL